MKHRDEKLYRLDIATYRLEIISARLESQISVTASTLLPWALIGVKSRPKEVSNEAAAQYCSQYYIIASSMAVRCCLCRRELSESSAFKKRKLFHGEQYNGKSKSLLMKCCWTLKNYIYLLTLFWKKH